MTAFKHYCQWYVRMFLLPLVTISTIFPRCHLIALLLARTTMFTLSSTFGTFGRAFVNSLELWPKADDIIIGVTSAAVGGKKHFNFISFDCWCSFVNSNNVHVYGVRDDTIAAVARWRSRWCCCCCGSVTHFCRFPCIVRD